jgi:hypothetical protein
MAKKPRARLIAEEILAECQLEGCEEAFVATTQATGQLLSQLELRAPRALEDYLAILRPLLQVQAALRASRKQKRR